jgi:hypothetical protein
MAGEGEGPPARVRVAVALAGMKSGRYEERQI